MNAVLRSCLPVLLASGLVALPPLRALPEAEAAAGRALVKSQADSVVGIEMVVVIKISGGTTAPRETKVEVNGTVVSASGLTVTALADIDPKVQFEAVRAAGGPAGRFDLGETDYKEVKLRLADGTEVPATVVLKDPDLNLAFIAPVPDAGGAKRTFTPVNLDNAADGTLLETYFLIARASKSLQRTPLVRPALVIGIVEKPRRLYLVNEQAAGSPVFDARGRVLGILVQHFGGGRGVSLVVLPAADVAEIAKQAAAVKPAEKPAEPAAEQKAPGGEAAAAPAAAN